MIMDLKPHLQIETRSPLLQCSIIQGVEWLVFAFPTCRHLWCELFADYPKNFLHFIYANGQFRISDAGQLNKSFMITDLIPHLQIETRSPLLQCSIIQGVKWLVVFAFSTCRHLWCQLFAKYPKKSLIYFIYANGQFRISDAWQLNKSFMITDYKPHLQIETRSPMFQCSIIQGIEWLVFAFPTCRHPWCQLFAKYQSFPFILFMQNALQMLSR